MTAYISRFFSRPGPSPGIRPRLRSRYEPGRETPLSGDSVAVESEPSEQQLPSNPTPNNEVHRRPAPMGVVTEAVPEQRFSPRTEPKVAPVEPEQRAPLACEDQHDVDQLPHHDDPPSEELRVNTSVEPAPGEAVPAVLLSVLDTPTPRATPDHRSDHVAVPVHAATPRAAEGEDGYELTVDVRYPRSHIETQPPLVALQPPPPAAPDQASKLQTGSPQPATSPNPLADLPAGLGRHNTQRSPLPEPISATASAQPKAKAPDPAVRQTIVNAIAEPVRAKATEVVVHIDRIDVRAPTSSAPAQPESGRARAAPTSLDSYLRSRSRRGAR